MSGDRFLLVKGGSGLGNRICVLLSGILYSRVTGRTLLVDWRDGLCAPWGTNAFPLLFQSPPCGPFDRLTETVSVRPAIWRDRLHEPSYRMVEVHGRRLDAMARRRLFSVDLSRADYDDEVLVLWDYIPQMDALRGHFRGSLEGFAEKSDDEVLRSVLRSELMLRPEICERAKDFKREHFGFRTVGVHVRYSDYRTSLWSILRKLNIVLEREPGIRIFLATDNVVVKELFEKNYPDVVTTPHWYPACGRAIHFSVWKRDPLAATVDPPNATIDPLSATVEALVDLYLLADCEWLVIDRSSNFSYLAKLLSTAPSSQVLDVGAGSKGVVTRLKRAWQAMVHLGVFRWGLRFLPRLARLAG